MKKIFTAATLFFFVAAQAQDETIKKLQTEAGKAIAKNAADTVPKKWKKGGMYNLNLAQGSLKNWAAGGDDFSLTISSILNLFAFYKEGKHSWDNTFDFNFGYVRTTSLGSRKNDDRFDFLSKYGRSIAPKWNLAGLFNLRSQMAKGYTYEGDVRTLSSAFFSPGYILLSAGLDYKPNDRFSVFISPSTARWIIVRDDTLAAKGLYGVDPGKHSELEIGAFLTANYIKELNRVVAYKGRLDLFSNYRHNPKNVDLFWSNVFGVKLSRALSASWNIDFIYDDDVKIFGKTGRSPALQVKSLIGAGLSLKF